MMRFPEMPRAALGCALALALSAAGPLHAAGVAVITSGNVRSYEEAKEGFRKQFGKRFKEYSLSSLMSNDLKVMNEIEAQAPDLVVAVGARAANAARVSLPSVPLVYCLVVNPEQNGLAGREKTYGVRFSVDELTMIERFKSLVPSMKRVGLITGNLAQQRPWIGKVTEAAQKAGVQVFVEEAPSVADVARALRSLKGKVDAFWMTTDPILTNQTSFEIIAAHCKQTQIPLLVPVESLVKVGGLAAVTASYESMGRDAAVIAEQMLSGHAPEAGEYAPTRTAVTVSLKAAQAIGLQIPEKSLESASVLR